MLIKAGSEGYYSPVMTGEGQKKKREGERGEGRGIPFVNSQTPGSAPFLALLRGLPVGKGAFPGLEKVDS